MLKNWSIFFLKTSIIIIIIIFRCFCLVSIFLFGTFSFLFVYFCFHHHSSVIIQNTSHNPLFLHYSSPNVHGFDSFILFYLVILSIHYCIITHSLIIITHSYQQLECITLVYYCWNTRPSLLSNIVWTIYLVPRLIYVNWFSMNL